MDHSFPLLIVIVFVVVMAVNGVYPVSVAVMLLGIGAVWVLLSKKYGGRIGKMLLWGTLLSVLILALFVGLLLLSDYAAWLRSIMLWPLSPLS
ncbi:MAG: hypothetical protein E7469_06005 [Ruminococcaceae bacterium]|nr:hypothetical protein [Oscillospiraceae bacterium]